MKYILNELPIKTTNSFKINDLEINLDIQEMNTNKPYKIDGIETKQVIKEKEITSRVGLNFKKYLELTINVSGIIDKPIFINYDFSDDDILSSNIIINYQENSKADFIIKYKSIDKNKHFNHIKEEVIAKDNSEGSITYINCMNDKSTNIIALEDKLNKKSDITHNLIDLSGNIRIYNAYMESIGNESKNSLNNIYIGKNNDLIDMNYYFKNIGKKSFSSLKVEGILDNNSMKNFRGTIDFIKGSVDSSGEENENCLLLSDRCISRSLPMMLCHEENVKGSHGQSTGKINQDKLFYLMCKGLTKKDAEKLIIISNFTEIIYKMKSDDLKKEILDLISENI